MRDVQMQPQKVLWRYWGVVGGTGPGNQHRANTPVCRLMGTPPAWPGMFLLCQPLQAPTPCKSLGESLLSETEGCQSSNTSEQINAAAQLLLSSSRLVHSHF